MMLLAKCSWAILATALPALAQLREVGEDDVPQHGGQREV